ncbi:hypothetical protein [Mesorhizobium loti]|uniref:Uncharacterized protein n=1 Tax=Rhizobium loti TaxID=381 RepID=A0A1A5IM77_RHILI|nr:hypothetical protein [Mesorhizobium loti]OBP80076.1 hypothetical protein BAE39_27600 [Mesorhizobium loti]OBQ59136.1 hypothetical protein A8145_26220 [Mesorhizobium loti]QKC73275.1 hypothetical protein EB815_32300 [Mesorhizobium loti]
MAVRSTINPTGIKDNNRGLLAMVLNSPTKQHHGTAKIIKVDGMEQPFETASKAPTLVVLYITKRKKRSMEQMPPSAWILALT